jgi:hypothetical protein
MSYASDHADALAALQSAGARLTFTLKSPGEYDALTDTRTEPEVLEAKGAAMEVKGDPEEYAALGLIRSSSVTLLFAPSTYGLAPDLAGYSVTWGGKEYVVKSTEPLAPDGNAILTRVVCSL